MANQNKVYKNCWNCKHMTYEYGDVGSSEGFVCNKKESWSGNIYKIEKEMLRNMERLDFLNKGKKCCDMFEQPMKGIYKSWKEVPM